MFAGKYFRKWDLGNEVTLNVVADEAKYLEASPDHIARHAALVSEAVALFGVRHFDRYEFLLALTDEMGGIGLEHHRSSENSRNPDYFTKWDRSEEHTSELQSLMRISYAVFCLKKKKHKKTNIAP